MNTELFEKYYKLGINHYMFKYVMGLKKPNITVKLFYFGLILVTIVAGTTLF